MNDSVINQLLSQIDGVNQLNNILIIGMTNRKDMIDPALLRPVSLYILFLFLMSISESQSLLLMFY